MYFYDLTKWASALSYTPILLKKIITFFQCFFFFTCICSIFFILLTQGIKADKFQKYDYGPEGNMKHYNQVTILTETLTT